MYITQHSSSSSSSVTQFAVTGAGDIDFSGATGTCKLGPCATAPPTTFTSETTFSQGINVTGDTTIEGGSNGDKVSVFVYRFICIISSSSC